MRIKKIKIRNFYGLFEIFHFVDLKTNLMNISLQMNILKTNYFSIENLKTYYKKHLLKEIVLLWLGQSKIKIN